MHSILYFCRVKKRVLVLGVFLCLLGTTIAQDRPFQKDPNRENTNGVDQDGFPTDSDDNASQSGLKNGKLLDDSTKNIYGPTTTKYTFEKNIKYNQPQYYVIDTLLDNLHRFNYVDKNKNQVQDLGNIGTAAMPVFYELPRTIGVSSGIHIYDLYFRSSDEIKYYNSHSPFTNMDITIGGNGRAITEVSYSRNINPNWNIGFDYKGLYVDKQIQSTGKGDRNVLSNAYDIYTHFQTKDRKYELLANLSRNMHKVNEFGGVLVEDQTILSDYFEQNADNILEEAATQELRTNVHIFQQWKFSDLIQAYHQIDRSKQENTFKDAPIDSAFHDAIFLDSTGTFDRVDFHTITSEQGVKGDVGNLFYNFYHKTRYFDMDYNNIHRDTVDLETKGFEQYGGAIMRLQIDSLTSISGDLEYLVGSNYQIGGLFQAGRYAFGFRRMQYEPSFIEKYYYGNHDQWVNDFKATKVDEFKGNLNVSFGKLTLKPFGRWLLFNDYIYFDQQGEPAQVSDLQLLNIGTEIQTNLWNRIYLNIYGTYSSVQGNNREAMRVPELLFNTKLYYQNIVFDGNLQFQLGVDTHWKSAYDANAYDPTIQQFYRQDGFSLREFPRVDIFANLKINRGRLFVKYINLLKAFYEVGYFASPEYIGQINGVDFGFKWAFYD